MNTSELLSMSAPTPPAPPRLGLLPTLILLGAIATLSQPGMAAGKLGWPGTDLHGRFCEGEYSNIGPFDYADPVRRRNNLPIVEEYHFTPKIRLLIHGKTGSLEGDIHYTLRAFPNHYIALESMMNLELLKGVKLNPPMMCYFNRAIAFRPKDFRVRMLEGIYLRRRHYYKLALQAFQEAEKLNPKSPELAYNIGLLLVDMKRYKQAAQYAKKAYAAGYPLQGLRKTLKKKGYRV